MGQCWKLSLRVGVRHGWNLLLISNIFFNAMLVVSLLNFVLPVRTNNESLLTASDSPLVCANCRDCMESPSRETVKRIRDSTHRALCFTKQWTNAGLMTIDRGGERPKIENWNAYISERCPNKQYRHKRPEQWCFCGTNYCNDETMSIYGEPGKYFRSPDFFPDDQLRTLNSSSEIPSTYSTLEERRPAAN